MRIRHLSSVAGFVVCMYEDTQCYTWWYLKEENQWLHGECSPRVFDNTKCLDNKCTKCGEEIPPSLILFAKFN